MTLEEWDHLQTAPALVREEVLHDPETANVVRKARELYGDDLCGVILHGKWVRGEAARTEPVDFLFVMRPGAMPDEPGANLSERVDREIAWSGLEVAWHRRETEPNVLSLRTPLSETGTWREIVRDKGIILHDPDGMVQAGLDDLSERIDCEPLAGDSRNVSHAAHG